MRLTISRAAQRRVRCIRLLAVANYRRALIAESAGSGGAGGVFFGRPRGRLPGLGGSAPLARTAMALASEVTRPPRRPRACADLFFTGCEEVATAVHSFEPPLLSLGRNRSVCPKIFTAFFQGHARDFYLCLGSVHIGDNSKPIRLFKNYFRKSFGANFLGRRGRGAGVENGESKSAAQTANDGSEPRRT